MCNLYWARRICACTKLDQPPHKNGKNIMEIDGVPRHIIANQTSVETGIACEYEMERNWPNSGLSPEGRGTVRCKYAQFPAEMEIPPIFVKQLCKYCESRCNSDEEDDKNEAADGKPSSSQDPKGKENMSERERRHLERERRSRARSKRT